MKDTKGNFVSFVVHEIRTLPADVGGTLLLQRRTVSASPTTVPSAHIFAWRAARSCSSSNIPRFVHNDRLCATPPRPQSPAEYSARRKAPRHAPERFAH